MKCPWCKKEVSLDKYVDHLRVCPKYKTTNPTKRIRLRNHITFKRASKAIIEFFYKLLSYYNLPTEITEEWLTLTLKVEVFIGKGGTTTGFEIDLGVYSTSHALLHELYHYKDYLNWRKTTKKALKEIKRIGKEKLDEEFRIVTRLPTNKEYFIKETNADTFADKESPKWETKYHNSVFPLQCNFAEQVDIIYKGKLYAVFDDTTAKKYLLPLRNSD